MGLVDEEEGIVELVEAAEGEEVLKGKPRYQAKRVQLLPEAAVGVAVAEVAAVDAALKVLPIPTAAAYSAPKTAAQPGRS